jgi:hypothetical protein
MARIITGGQRGTRELVRAQRVRIFRRYFFRPGWIDRGTAFVSGLDEQTPPW